MDTLQRTIVRIGSYNVFLLCNDASKIICVLELVQQGFHDAQQTTIIPLFRNFSLLSDAESKSGRWGLLLGRPRVP